MFFFALSISPTDTSHAGDSTFQNVAIRATKFIPSPIQITVWASLEMNLRKKVTYSCAAVSPTARAVPANALCL